MLYVFYAYTMENSHLEPKSHGGLVRMDFPFQFREIFRFEIFLFRVKFPGVAKTSTVRRFWHHGLGIWGVAP